MTLLTRCFENAKQTTATSADSAGETRPPIPTPTTTPLGGGGKGEGDHDNEAPSTDGEADGAPVEAARDVDGREERRESNDGSVGLEGEEAGEAEDEEEEEEEEFNPYCFIAHLPPYNTVKHITPTVSECSGYCIGLWRGYLLCCPLQTLRKVVPLFVEVFLPRTHITTVFNLDFSSPSGRGDANIFLSDNVVIVSTGGTVSDIE